MGCTSDLFEDGLELHELIRGYYKQLLEDLCRIMDYFRVDVLCKEQVAGIRKRLAPSGRCDVM